MAAAGLNSLSKAADKLKEIT